MTSTAEVKNWSSISTPLRAFMERKETNLSFLTLPYRNSVPQGFKPATHSVGLANRIKGIRSLQLTMLISY
jgi:hypothetical protein